MRKRNFVEQKGCLTSFGLFANAERDRRVTDGELFDIRETFLQRANSLLLQTIVDAIAFITSHKYQYKYERLNKAVQAEKKV